MMEAKEKERYLRQMNVAELGEKGQQKLKDTTFLVIGAGGLGSRLRCCSQRPGPARSSSPTSIPWKSTICPASSSTQMPVLE